jgi:hypothetical protein
MTFERGSPIYIDPAIVSDNSFTTLAPVDSNDIKSVHARSPVVHDVSVQNRCIHPIRKENSNLWMEVSMSRKSFLLMASLFFIATADQLFAQGVVKQLDAGLSAGTVLFSDTVGFNGSLETRAYLAEPVTGLELYAGVGGLFQYTSDSRHTMTDYYGYALGGVDWFYLGNVVPALKPLALRAQLALGGGYTSDVNSDDQKEGSGGFLVLPALGTDYAFGKLHASLMFGYELKAAGGTVLGGTTLSLGLSYSIF